MNSQVDGFTCDPIPPNWNQEQRDACIALERLAESDPVGVQQVVSRVVSNMRKQAMFEKGVSYAKQNSIQRLIGVVDSISLHAPPADDHGVMLDRAGEPYLYLSEPYGLGYDSLRQIISFCERHGLVAGIDAAESIWNPGRSTAVVYTKRGTLGSVWRRDCVGE
jgi:hypothetical protein